MTFAWIEERKDEWPIRLLCHTLGVSRSGYYAWLARKASDAEVRREELTEEVKEIHAEVKGRYGSPRIHAELVDRGHECSVNFVAQVMREAGIAAKTKRKFRQTTDSNPTLPVARTSSIGTSTRRSRTRAGVPTSPTSRRARGGCTWRW